MAVKIRLARGGAKKRPYYRVVVADIRAPRDGKFIEKVGTYNPLLSKDDPNRVILKEDRIKHWLSTGAKPTDRVERFLRTAGIVGTKPVYPEKKRPPKKAKAEAPAEETPAEEAPAPEATSEDAA